jgi:hypothetical protein
MQVHEEQDLQPERPTPVPETEPEAVEAPPVEGAAKVAAQPSRKFRRILLWAVGFVVVFAAGVVLSWYLQVRPQAAQIADLSAEVLYAQEQIDELSAEVEGLRPLVEENAALAEELILTSAHLDLLSVLVDVTTAQLALAQEDDIAARAALTDTDERLGALKSTLEGANATEVSDMMGRLALVIEEVESDTFAARRDLEILANNLLALERVLFEE